MKCEWRVASVEPPFANPRHTTFKTKAALKLNEVTSTISASAYVPDTSKDSSRYVPALDDLSSFAYQSQRSGCDPHLIGGLNPT
ncbi:hypothetical protein Bca52824_082220 [Brassica carinata]|uniref:Uncharacterized protein n=1 Tax=Brassica carinata TaxID=52824 RepID=A0A8X7PM68_BRACI|nr:hypothetical protein Bca52824_082220 [Brassica carinata]